MSSEHAMSLVGTPTIQFCKPGTVLLTLRNDGTYELGGSVDEMLSHESPVVRAFGAALRDQYEAGRRGEPAPKDGRADA